MLRLPVLGELAELIVADDVGEVVDPAPVADNSVPDKEVVVVEDAAKTYPLTWTA
jgi:hypothetical protein